MNKKKIAGLVISVFIISVAGLRIKYEYFDIYRLSLNGKVSAKWYTAKENLFITVNGENHNLSHYWPVLQKNLEIGDSVVKSAGENKVLLIKKDNNKKITCNK